MFFEEFCGVFAKAAEQVVELAFVGVVDTEFVDCCGRRCGARLVLSRAGPICRWEQSYCRKRLKQGAPFHGSNSSRAFAGWGELGRRETGARDEALGGFPTTHVAGAFPLFTLSVQNLRLRPTLRLFKIEHRAMQEPSGHAAQEKSANG